MNWQYQTILFEFQKDGLLGDKYVDDEEMEKILNEQGEQGWELVNVTAVQEGLLTFFKRERQQPRIQASTRGEQTVATRPAAPQAPPISPPQPGRAPGVEEQRPLVQKKKPSTIGEIKIS